MEDQLCPAVWLALIGKKPRNAVQLSGELYTKTVVKSHRAEESRRGRNVPFSLSARYGALSLTKLYLFLIFPAITETPIASLS